MLLPAGWLICMKKCFMNNWQKLLLTIFVSCFVLLSLGSSLRESLTFDEIVYLQEGRQALLHHTFSIDPYNPPLMKELVTLPYMFTNRLPADATFSMHYPLAAKIMVLLFGVGILLLTYRIAKKYFGGEVGLFAVFLLAFEPTMIANSHIATLDIGLTFFFLLAFFIFLQLFRKENKKYILPFAVSVGLGVATKLSFIPFFISSTFLVGLYLSGWNFVRKIWQQKKTLVIAGLLMLLTIWATYWFVSTPLIKNRQDSTRVSSHLIAFAQKHHLPLLQNAIRWGQVFPIPLGDYGAIVKNTLLRKSSGQCFFLGTYFPSCRWYFFTINLFIKMPLPLLIFFFSSVVLFIKTKKLQKNFVVFFIPIFCIVGIGSVSTMQPLVRYLLPAFPLFAIIAGASWHVWQKSFISKLFLASICFWYILTAAIAFPHFLSYANEFAGYPQQRFALLTDSNLDWGQSLPDVSSFVQKEKPKTVLFSYFGRDNGDWYSLQSNTHYGSYKNNEICAFHTLLLSNRKGKNFTLISSSNWYNCGYDKEKRFAKDKIKGILGDAILVF